VNALTNVYGYTPTSTVAFRRLAALAVSGALWRRVPFCELLRHKDMSPHTRDARLIRLARRYFGLYYHPEAFYSWY